MSMMKIKMRMIMMIMILMMIDQMESLLNHLQSLIII